MTCADFHAIAPRAFNLSVTEMATMIRHMDDCQSCRDFCAQVDAELTALLPVEISMAVDDLGSQLADAVVRQEKIDQELPQ